MVVIADGFGRGGGELNPEVAVQIVVTGAIGLVIRFYMHSGRLRE